ncbi:MAG: acetoacetate--CoA ligase, partial [Pseudomonadota bacterium]
MSDPMWKPSGYCIAGANLTPFMALAEREYGASAASYSDLYRWSIEHPADFWRAVWDFSGVVAETRGDTVLEHAERFPGARWFPGARLNYAENLLRKRGDQPAIIFNGEHGAKRPLSFTELYNQVTRLSAALRNMGIRRGDRIAGILPNMPEAVIALLAAAGIGAIWSSCSPDFGVNGVVDRFGQIEPRVLFAVDGYYYNGKRYSSADRLRQIMDALPSVETLVLVPYADEASDAGIVKGVLFDDFIASYRPGEIPFERLPFDHPLYILYSSGTTGPPKCIVHGAGGTLLQHFKEHLLHTDVHPGDRLFYFTTCGWMMWNWLVSGLASGATLVLYDGSPFFPGPQALFDLIDEVGINIFGVSAKYIEAVKKSGIVPKNTHSLSTLKTVLSTGSPLAPESFDFIYASIKSDVCLSSISGGTDIVSCFVLGAPVLPVWRGEIQCLGLAMKVEVFDEQGRPTDGKGELVCTAPFPSMPVGFWKDPDGKKFHGAYFDKFPGVWCHGDFVELTEHGGMIIHGRSDAVLNPGGVRIGTAEIYRQVEQFDEVLESLVIGQDWEADVRVVLFVKLRAGTALDEDLTSRIRQRIRENLSPRHVPAKILQVRDIPRTKSGKIV